MPAIEDHIHDYLEDAIEAADEQSVLFGAELHDTVYRSIKKKFGIRVGNGESDLAPTPGGAQVAEFDGAVPLVVYALVEGPDRSDRKAARSRVLEMSKAIAQLFFNDPTMGGRVSDSRVTKFPRGWDAFDSSPYAVANPLVLVNETGAVGG